MAVEFKDISGIITDSPFTDNQLRAVTEDGNMIVSAGAGSGKTTVLIQRVYNLLTYGRGSDSDFVPEEASEEDLEFLERFPSSRTIWNGAVPAACARWMCRSPGRSSPSPLPTRPRGN